MLIFPDTVPQDHIPQHTGARQVVPRAAVLASASTCDWFWMLLSCCFPSTYISDHSTQWPPAKLISFPLSLCSCKLFLAVVFPLPLSIILSQQSYFCDFSSVSAGCLLALSPQHESRQHIYSMWSIPWILHIHTSKLLEKGEAMARISGRGFHQRSLRRSAGTKLAQKQ